MLVLPTKTSLIWERFFKENNILVYKYIVRQIKKELNENNSRIELFKSEDNLLHVWIPQNQIPNFLSEALKAFIKAEEYEYASHVKKLVDSYHILMLINETKLEE